jgi:hypothetical protein
MASGDVAISGNSPVIDESPAISEPEAFAASPELAEAQIFAESPVVTEPPAVAEVPVNEAPVNEVPVNEAPVNEVPVNEAPVAEVPVTEAPAIEENPEIAIVETPAPEVPIQEVPLEEAPIEEAPIEEAPIEEIPDVEEIPVPLVLGEFSTEFGDSIAARKANIALASKSINGAVVQPGEIFSYNDTIGPTTQGNGYQKAGIFVNGKQSFGYGGGVCQVSSTLFNAVQRAGLEVIERHNHSRRVTYVPKGKDAATSYGVIDFRFRNNMSYPVSIESSVSGSKILIKIVSS